MIYLLAALLGLIAFVLTGKFGRKTRSAIALAVFLIPSILMTALVVIVGDKASPDAVTIKSCCDER